MGVLSSILLWPLAPVRAVMSLGEVIQQQVEQQQRDPAVARRTLEAAEDAYRAGDISAEELARIQQDVLDGMYAGSGGGLELITRTSQEKR